MVYDVLRTIDLDQRIINNAYDDLFNLFRDINMEAEADDLIEGLANELKTNNPFSCSYNGTFCASPTDTVIFVMYSLAKAMIMKKYPNVAVSYTVSEYNSTFDIDDETYKIGHDAYIRGEE